MPEQTDPSAYSVLPGDLLLEFDFKILSQVLQQERFRIEHTDREVEVLQHLGEGFNNPMIADKLSISRYTVETHRKHLNWKLDIQSYGKLVKYALAFDLVQY